MDEREEVVSDRTDSWDARHTHRECVLGPNGHYWRDKSPPPAGGADARETTRELSEAELDAIDARALAAAAIRRRFWNDQQDAFVQLDPQTVRALVAMARRAKP